MHPASDFASRIEAVLRLVVLGNIEPPWENCSNTTGRICGCFPNGVWDRS